MRSFLLCALALALAAPASAQIARGDLEIAGAAGLSTRDGLTTLQLAPSAGYFLTPAVQAGLDLSYVRVSGNGQRSSGGTLGPFVAYHFNPPGARTVPFFGAQVGVTLTGEEQLSYGGFAGVKHFVSPGGAVSARAVVGSEDDELTFGTVLGVSVFF
ncbi:MAG: hypothetical protein ACK41D_04470 [Rubricoccaceae bacterium]